MTLKLFFHFMHLKMQNSPFIEGRELCRRNEKLQLLLLKNGKESAVPEHCCQTSSDSLLYTLVKVCVLEK